MPEEQEYQLFPYKKKKKKKKPSLSFEIGKVFDVKPSEKIDVEASRFKGAKGQCGDRGENEQETNFYNYRYVDRRF